MNKKLMIGLVTLGLGAFTLIGGSKVFAADTSTGNPPFARVGQAIGNCAGAIQDTMTNLLGLSHDEIMTKRQSGESLSQIAADKGIDEQKLIDTMTQARKERMNQAVKDGYLTQDQANERLEWMEQNMGSHIKDTGFGFGPRGYMGGSK